MLGEIPNAVQGVAGVLLIWDVLLCPMKSMSRAATSKEQFLCEVGYGKSTAENAGSSLTAFWSLSCIEGAEELRALRQHCRPIVGE